MHETGIVKDLVRRMEDAAREAGAERIVAATVWLGALSQFSPAHFREHFDEEVRGTMAQDAELTVQGSDDASDPNAQAVMLLSLDLEVIEN